MPVWSRGMPSSFLPEFAAGIIRAEFPYLKEKRHVRSAVMAWQSRVNHIILQTEQDRKECRNAS